jgi:ABC-type transporter Mla subunit MlaD
MPNFDNQTIQLALIAVVALALLLQAIVLLALYFSMRKAARSVKEGFEDLRDSISPIIDNTRELVSRVAPRIESSADDLAAMTHSLRRQTADVQASATEILERLRNQTVRLDGMITGVFNTMDKVSGFMADAVAKPMRQLSGILASVRAVVESLRNNAETAARPARAPEETNDDKDMFV